MKLHTGGYFFPDMV